MAACDYPKLEPVIRYLDSLAGRADLPVLASLLKNADVSRDDIASCCCFNANGYRRNVIKRTDRYELLALCWHSGDCTPIHDHRGSSCAFRIVEGVGTEVRFRKTPSGLITPTTSSDMHPGYVCAAEDDDIHQVANLQPPGTDLITLHIYSPPIATMRTYRFGQRDPLVEIDIGQYSRDNGGAPVLVA